MSSKVDTYTKTTDSIFFILIEGNMPEFPAYYIYGLTIDFYCFFFAQSYSSFFAKKSQILQELFSLKVISFGVSNAIVDSDAISEPPIV